MYEMHTEIPFTESGADGTLKLRSAVAMMMDCCQFQEYQEQEFCKFLRENHLAVFLFSMQLDILRFPAFREKVTTAVKIYGCRSVCGLRRITMRDEAGKLCLLSNATGAFFDTVAKKAIKLTPEMLCVKFDEAEPMECLPRKIPVPPQGGECVLSVPVTLSKLDPNGHLTSPEYFALAGDAVGRRFAYNRLRFEFKEQAKEGETVSAYLFQTAENKYVVDMRNPEGRSCAVAEFSSFEPDEQYFDH